MAVNIFRGQVQHDTKFHLYFESLTASELMTAIGITKFVKTFILCMCINSENETILYWSCDPSDFVPNIRGTARNYGAAYLTYTFIPGSNKYQLFYQNPNNVLTPLYDNIVSNSFAMRPYEGNSTSNIFYYNYPGGYSILSLVTKTKWNFRNTNSLGSGTPGDNEIYTPSLTNTSNFFSMNTKLITISGVTVSGRYLTYTSGDIIPNSGIIYLVDAGANKQAFSYAHVSGSTTIILSEDHIFKSNPVLPYGTSAYIYVRNDKDNFTSQEANDLPINFMPITEHSYFSGIGNKISQHNIDYTLTNLTYFYNNSGTLTELNGKITLSSLLLFVNSVLGFFTATEQDGYVKLSGSLATSKPDDSVTTISVFSNPMDAHQKYFYNYCGQNEYCGKCMGRTLNANICTTTYKTNELFLNNEPSLSTSVINGPFLDGYQEKNMPKRLSDSNKGLSGLDARVFLPRVIIIPIGVVVSLLLAYYARYYDSLLEKNFDKQDFLEKETYELETEHHDVGLLTGFMSILNFAFGIAAVSFLLFPGENFISPNNIKVDGEDKNPTDTYHILQYAVIGLAFISCIILFSVGFVFYREKNLERDIMTQTQEVLENHTKNYKSIRNFILGIGIFLIFFGGAYIGLGIGIAEESEDLTIVHEQPNVSIASYIAGAICIIIGIIYLINWYTFKGRIDTLLKTNYSKQKETYNPLFSRQAVRPPPPGSGPPNPRVV